MKTFKKFLIIFLCVWSLPNLSFGQAAAGGQTEGSLLDDSLADMTIVLVSGGVGAILGLSTLSFEDEFDWNHVITGGAIGIIIGVGVVAYMQAQKSRSSMLQQDRQQAFSIGEDMNSFERTAWHYENFNANKSRAYINQVNYTFSF